MSEHIQWKVKCNDWVDTYDTLSAAKRAYGIVKKEMKEAEENSGLFVELHGRSSYKGQFDLIMEFRFEEEEEEEDEEEEDDEEEEEEDEEDEEDEEEEEEEENDTK